MKLRIDSAIGRERTTSCTPPGAIPPELYGFSLPSSGTSSTDTARERKMMCSAGDGGKLSESVVFIGGSMAGLLALLR